MAESKKQVLDCKASDHEYLHKDFHGALCYSIRYLDEHYGQDATHEYLQQVGRTYFAPLTEALNGEPTPMWLLFAVSERPYLVFLHGHAPPRRSFGPPCGAVSTSLRHTLTKYLLIPLGQDSVPIESVANADESVAHIG